MARGAYARVFPIQVSDGQQGTVLPECVSRDRLGYAVVTKAPQLPAAQKDKGLLLTCVSFSGQPWRCGLPSALLGPG